jgi:hypothetical protein
VQSVGSSHEPPPKPAAAESAAEPSEKSKVNIVPATVFQ